MHVYRTGTGLLTVIMNLVSPVRVCTQRQANASAEQLTRGGGWGVEDVFFFFLNINYDRD